MQLEVPPLVTEYLRLGKAERVGLFWDLQGGQGAGQALRDTPSAGSLPVPGPRGAEGEPGVREAGESRRAGLGTRQEAGEGGLRSLQPIP